MLSHSCLSCDAAYVRHANCSAAVLAPHKNIVTARVHGQSVNGSVQRRIQLVTATVACQVHGASV